jgi:hypothetical protein
VLVSVGVDRPVTYASITDQRSPSGFMHS